MNSGPIPTKCMEIEAAAHLLGITRKQLYKNLRTLKWLHTGKYKNDPAHNSPKEWAIKAGLATTQTRGRPAPYNKELTVLYQVTLLTEHGLSEIRKMNPSMETPEIKPLTAEAAQSIKEPKSNTDQHAADRERDIVMAQLKAWGLAN